MRRDYLKDAFRGYLDRRSVPQNLRDKPEARQAEMQALLGKLISLAPKENYQDWFTRLTNNIDDNAEFRTWPTVKEIGRAASAIAGSSSRRAEDVEIDHAAAVVAAIRAGEPVADMWIRRPDQLFARGLTEDELAPYRRSLEWTDGYRTKAYEGAAQ